MKDSMTTTKINHEYEKLKIIDMLEELNWKKLCQHLIQELPNASFDYYDDSYNVYVPIDDEYSAVFSNEGGHPFVSVQNSQCDIILEVPFFGWRTANYLFENEFNSINIG